MADSKRILSLAGRHALITGGGRGIGRSTALALADAGADIAVTARTTAEIDQVAAEVRAMGRQGLAVACDVTDPAQVAHMVDTAATELGGIDILINNAGLGESHKFLGHPDELWHKLIAVNLTSAYLVTKAVAPLMVDQDWGRVINMGSIASKVGSKYIVAYTAAKHGLLGLTRALAVELVSNHITVNAICPGYVDTPMTDGAVATITQRTGMSEDEARRRLAETSPQGRLIAPEEVAALAVFLAGDAAAGITGQAINIDGGTVMF
jgi:3-hydroxybutyrate dehydrogenase